MSQSKVGDAVGLTFQQIQKYERGHPLREPLVVGLITRCTVPIPTPTLVAMVRMDPHEVL